MDARRLSAQFHDRSHERFPVHLQSEKRRHRLLSSESEDGRPHVHRTIHSGGYAGDHYLPGGAGLIPRGASSSASARFSFISRDFGGPAAERSLRALVNHSETVSPWNTAASDYRRSEEHT